MKRVIFFFTALCLTLSLCTVATATSPDSTSPIADKTSLINMLSHVEPQKSAYGLDDVDFSDLTIGNMIHSYEYVDEGFQELFGVYPLFLGDSLVALVLTSDGEHFQFATALTNEISDAGVSNIALVYDALGCYLYNGEGFALLAESTLGSDNRATLPVGISLLSEEGVTTSLDGLDKISLTALTPVEYIGYVSNANTRTQRYYCCNVPYVTQNPYENICWAACVASISIYLNDTSLDAVSVARRLGPADGDFDQTTYLSILADQMKQAYKLYYNYRKGIVLSESNIFNNIVSGYPVLGHFQVGAAAYTHTAVIYGIDLFSCYFDVMDPLYGMTSSYYNNGVFSFVSLKSGKTMTLTTGSLTYTM